MAFGHSPIPFPSGKAIKSSKRRFSGGVAVISDPATQDEAAIKLCQLLAAMEATIMVTGLALDGITSCGGHTRNGIAGTELVEFKSTLQAVQIAAKQFRAKFYRYEEGRAEV